MPTTYANPIPGLRLFHGSPHDFDRFSMSKIGTGEGAQAYGHGLYFAENEGIARDYRKNLSYKNLKDRFLNELQPDADYLEVEDLMGSGYFAPDQARLLTELGNNDWLGFDYPSQAISAAARGNIEYYDPTPELESAITNLGRMYEVNVNANPEDFLDWDKPLSAQPQAVRGAFSSLGAPERLANVRGEDAYRALGDQMGALEWPIGADATTRKSFYSNAAAKSSEALREAGIPGIRYLDAGSRSAGDGSRNYVVFDENLIEIVRKYGIAGAAAMLGISQADVAQAMQQQPQGLLSGAQ
jgi:hypothetical protein